MHHKKSGKISENLAILGVMTGTSCDALDASCIEFNSNGWDVRWNAAADYPQKLRTRVLEFQFPDTLHTIQKILELNRDVSEWYAVTLKKMMSGRKLNPHVIANHGQTVAHFPGAQGGGTTLQLGDPTRIASTTGLTVVSHFREGDLAGGGQGAPLAPLFHQILMRKLDHSKGGVALHNIGGISNLTYLAPDGSVLAFDTGPGNSWIDMAVEKVTQGKQHFDYAGERAARGKVDLRGLKAVLAHPYFARKIPKSTGRDDFPFQFLTSNSKARGDALIATATEITVESIALSYEQWIIKQGLPLKSIYICGGGAKNLTLLNRLQMRLSKVKVTTLASLDIDPQTFEAQAFAVLGFLSLFGQPLGGPWTGVKGFAPPGQLTPGKNWQQVLSKIALFPKNFRP